MCVYAAVLWLAFPFLLFSFLYVCLSVQQLEMTLSFIASACPPPCFTVGGIASVTLGDEAARK